MFARKVILTTTNIAVHFGVAQFIHRKLQQMKPELYTVFTTDSHYRQEVIKSWAKVIGVSVAVALVASVAAGLVVNQVDNVAFPNNSGPY